MLQREAAILMVSRERGGGGGEKCGRRAMGSGDEEGWGGGGWGERQGTYVAKEGLGGSGLIGKEEAGAGWGWRQRSKRSFFIGGVVLQWGMQHTEGAMYTVRLH